MASFAKKNKVPDTVIGEEGSAKRNIIRKGGPSKTRKEGLPGQSVDDGSTDVGNVALDENDPNYDSEDDTAGNVAIPKLSALHREDVAKSSITLSVYKKKVEAVVTEYFVSGDMGEVANSIQDIGAPEYSYELVKRLVNMSCDKSDRERELVSQLMSALYPDILSRYMIGKGFERLFEIIDEIEKDCPSARPILSTFLARSVIDEILPPSFLSDAVVCNLGGDVVDRAKLLLSREHAGAKLEHSWGPGDGRPVDEMKVVVDQVMQELMLSKDLNEAKRCISELNAPQFFHEIVKRAVINAIDKPDAEQALISQLLAELRKVEMLSAVQAEKGFKRLFDMLPDLVLDTPSASKVLAGFVDRAKTTGVLSSSFEAAPPAN